MAINKMLEGASTIEIIECLIKNDPSFSEDFNDVIEASGIKEYLEKSDPNKLKPTNKKNNLSQKEAYKTLANYVDQQVLRLRKKLQEKFGTQNIDSIFLPDYSTPVSPSRED